MEALYKINASEMDISLLESIRNLFKGKDIIIKVSADLDETEFLSFYPENEKHIRDNMVAEPVRKFSGDELQEFVTQKG